MPRDEFEDILGFDEYCDDEMSGDGTFDYYNRKGTKEENPDDMIATMFCNSEPDSLSEDVTDFANKMAERAGEE